MIGCTNRPADSSIPRSQAGRSGSGLEVRRPRSRATACDSPRRRRPYDTDLRHHHRHRARPLGWVRCSPARAAVGSGLGGNKPPSPRPATRSGPVPPGRVAVGSCQGGGEPPSPHPAVHAVGPGATRPGPRLRAGWAQTTRQPPTRVGGPVPSSQGPRGSPGCSLVRWFRELDHRCRPADRAAGQVSDQGCRA